MNDRLAALESAIDDLRSSIRRLEARLAHLEGQAASAGEAAAEAGAAGARTGCSRRRRRGPRLARSHRGAVAASAACFFVLGGRVPAPRHDRHRRHPAGSRRGPRPRLRAGVARVRRPGGRQGQRPSAVFHGVGAAMVAFPVVLEATTRFKVLPRGGQRGGARRPHGRHPGGGVAAPPAAAGLDCRRGRHSDRPSSFSPRRAWSCPTPSS